MTEHNFALLGQYQKLPGGKKTAVKRDRIAKKIDQSAGYTYYYDSAERRARGWGYCPNLGEPFDSATARAIQEAWATAGV